ncbi:MAG: zf-HC2 domain-containing protein [Mycolicibacterium sp.]|uniref:zf-HC2 domain-containing protein n=1 Tax=Mycolicibacterium sp. TaxID=2320850 RepID=UPI003D104C8D
MTGNRGAGRVLQNWDTATLAIRTALGLMFMVAGLKLIIPGPFGLGDDREQLVAGFTDPVTGFMAPWSVQFLTDHGVSASTGLFVQGVLEVLLALGLLAGVLTPRLAMVAAMMLVMFTVLSPTGGQIRLSRDLALAGAALALAFWGAGRWSVDRWLLRRGAVPYGRLARLGGLTAVARGGNRDRGLLVIRLGMVFTLGASALFAGGVFANPMNSSVPQAVLLIAAVVLAAGVGARYMMGGIAGWLVVIAVGKLISLGPLIGAENVKREIALAVVAATYTMVGPDRWVLPRPRRLRCRDVSELLAAYIDGGLPPMRRRAVEFHLADCPDCWTYLGTYRQTIELGQDLRDVRVPAQVYERLSALVGGRAGADAINPDRRR